MASAKSGQSGQKINLAGAGLGRISENGRILDLLEPEPKSGTIALESRKYECTRNGPNGPGRTCVHYYVGYELAEVRRLVSSAFIQ